MEVKEGIKPSFQSYQDRVLSLNYETITIPLYRGGVQLSNKINSNTYIFIFCGSI